MSKPPPIPPAAAWAYALETNIAQFSLLLPASPSGAVFLCGQTFRRTTPARICQAGTESATIYLRPPRNRSRAGPNLTRSEHRAQTPFEPRQPLDSGAFPV